MIRRPPRSTLSSSSAASDVYKRQVGGWGSVQQAGDLLDGAAGGPGQRVDHVRRPGGAWQADAGGGPTRGARSQRRTGVPAGTRPAVEAAAAEGGLRRTHGDRQRLGRVV